MSHGPLWQRLFSKGQRAAHRLADLCWLWLHRLCTAPGGHQECKRLACLKRVCIRYTKNANEVLGQEQLGADSSAARHNISTFFLNIGELVAAVTVTAVTSSQ